MLCDSRVRAVRSPSATTRPPPASWNSCAALPKPPNNAMASAQQRGNRQEHPPSVKNTCLANILLLLGPLVRYKVSDQVVELRIPGSEGRPVTDCPPPAGHGRKRPPPLVARPDLRVGQ